jgi:hypothetical protein
MQNQRFCTSSRGLLGAEDKPEKWVCEVFTFSGFVISFPTLAAQLLIYCISRDSYMLLKVLAVFFFVYASWTLGGLYYLKRVLFMLRKFRFSPFLWV